MTCEENAQGRNQAIVEPSVLAEHGGGATEKPRTNSSQGLQTSNHESHEQYFNVSGGLKALGHLLGYHSDNTSCPNSQKSSRPQHSTADTFS